MTKVLYLDSATNEEYTDGAFSYIEEAANRIKRIAGIVGISAAAVAGAMAEENSAYDYKDKLLDIYARSAMNPYTTIASLPNAFSRPENAAIWIATNIAVLNYTRRSHTEWVSLYNRSQRNSDIKLGVLDKTVNNSRKIFNPVLIDAGLGNFKIRTAISLIQKICNKERI